MVQEVQTWVWVYNETTLETIEAIGTSSFKIVEWRQTKGWHYVSSVTASWGASWSYSSSGAWNRQSPDIKATLSLSNPVWKYEYAIDDGGVRVPVPWTYEVTITASWGAWTMTVNSKVIKSDWTVIYTATTYWGSDTKVVKLDLGKFETLYAIFDFYYSWSSSWAFLSGSITMDIQQL